VNTLELVIRAADVSAN